MCGGRESGVGCTVVPNVALTSGRASVPFVADLWRDARFKESPEDGRLLLQWMRSHAVFAFAARGGQYVDARTSAATD